MNKLMSILSFFCLLTSFSTFAQIDNIPNQVPGKCYAQSIIPDIYETQTETIVVKEASTKTEVIPAVYGVDTILVLKKEASSRIEKKPAIYSTQTTRHRVGCPDGYMDGLSPNGSGIDECYKLVHVPPTYKTVAEEVVIKEATTRLEVVPAIFATRRVKDVLLEAASFRIESKPVPYTTVSEKIEVQAPTTKLVKKRDDKNCLSSDPNDCLVWYSVEVPAQYQTIERKVKGSCGEGWTLEGETCIRRVEIPAKYISRTEDVVVTPATTKIVSVPEQTKTITKRVIDTPATQTKVNVDPIYEEYTTTTRVGCPNGYKYENPGNPSDDCIRVVEIPAEYATATKRIIISPPSTRMVQVPAETKTVTKKTLVKQGGYSEWREVVCGSDINTVLISQVQYALMAKGYDVGSAGADKVLGKSTKAALIEFQRDNGLPVGNLDFETLRALGIKK